MAWVCSGEGVCGDALERVKRVNAEVVLDRKTYGRGCWPSAIITLTSWVSRRPGNLRDAVRLLMLSSISDARS